MIDKTYNLALDITYGALRKYDYLLVSNDNDVYTFNITLTNANATLDLTNVDHIDIVFEKEDKTTVQYSTLDGTRLQITDATNGIITYEVGTQEIAKDGNVTGEIHLYGSSNERITSCQFTFKVRQDIDTDNAVKSTSEYSTLANLILEVESLIAGEEPLAQQVQQDLEDLGLVVTDHETRIQKIEQPQTLPLSTSSPVTSFPTGTLDGAVQDLVIEGQTLDNSVENGDFSDGTTGWSEVNSSLSESNNVLSITGDGSGASPRGRQVDTKVNASTGDLIFLYAKVRITNSESTQIYYGLDGITDELIVQSNPTQDEWYELYGIAVANEDNEYIITFRHYYVDSATANGKVMEVDGNAGVFAINMTQLGIESYTEEQMLEICRNGYFEGTQSPENLTLEARGKNKFDKSKVTMNSTLTWASGAEYSESGSVSSDFIKIKPETGYLVNVSCYLFFYNEYRNYLGNSEDLRTGNGSNYIAFTSPKNVNYVRLVRRTDGIDYLDVWQLEENKGQTLGVYTPYKSSILKTDFTMRSLPNGVKDTVENGKYVQKVSNPYTEFHTLTGWSIYDDTDPNYITFATTHNDIPDDIASQGVDSNSIRLTLDNSVQITADYENGEYIYTTGSYWRIVVLRTRLTTEDVAGFETWLGGFSSSKLTYQLAEPIITDFNGVLNAYEDGDLVISSDTNVLPSNVSMNVPSNLGAKIDANSKAIDAISDYTNDMAKYQESFIEPTLLNGWVNYGSTYANAGYYKDDFGDVHLVGMVKSGTSGTVIFNLPSGYRPPSDLIVPILTSSGSDLAGSIKIYSNGDVELRTGGTTFVLLNNISFRAQGV